MKGTRRGKRMNALFGVLMAGLLFAMPVFGATLTSSLGELVTAGAAHILEPGIFDTVSANRVLSSAGATTTIETLKAEQIEESIAGYKNLGVAHVENHLNVRTEPNEESELAGKMTKNAGCEILEVNGEWAHINSGKVDGYVNTQYLLTGDEAKERARQVMTLMATVTTTTLFVREEPTTESSVITMVPMEEELEVTEGEEGDDWIKIAIDEDEGYVSTQYVTISERLDKAVTMKELRYGMGVSDLRVNIVNYSKQFLGNPYVWGGTSLTKGADCSGYVQSVFRHFNIRLPRTSREQARVGQKISASDAKPGDLFFYGKGGVVNHVAIYIGGGQVINASNPRSGIKISNAYYRTPYAVRRVISD
ncbi:MAG: C40 family peptidase [Lachnospiraceae bacterium]|nr:C40 family peptidase [Lachnospiraceae bacterium]